MIGIYKITNLETGDFYIGQSKNTDRRWNDHFSGWIASAHSKKFQQDIDKFGREGFRCEVIQECEETELISLERYWINKLKPTYNTVFDGHPVSEETKTKIRQSLSGRTQPIELVEKRKAALKKRYAVSPKTNEQCRKRVAVQLDTVMEFESVKSASEYLGVHPSTMTHALKQNGKVKGHKVWYVV